jgi:choline transport protein
MTFLIYHVFLIGPVVTNMTPGILPAISVLGGVFNVAGMIAWAAVFLAMAPRNSADFVFTTFINESGWSSKGWVFTLSLYVPMYGMYGTDSTLHMVEEMVNPARDAPRVMIWSMVFSAVVAWISAVIMGFTSGNWAAEMETTLPYLSWFMNTTRSVLGGGIFCAVMMMGLNVRRNGICIHVDAC